MVPDPAIHNIHDIVEARACRGLAPGTFSHKNVAAPTMVILEVHRAVSESVAPAGSCTGSVILIFAGIFVVFAGGKKLARRIAMLALAHIINATKGSGSSAASSGFHHFGPDHRELSSDRRHWS